MARILTAILFVFVVRDGSAAIATMGFATMSKTMFDNIQTVALWGGAGIMSLSLVSHFAGGHQLEGMANKLTNYGVGIGAALTVGGIASMVPGASGALI